MSKFIYFDVFSNNTSNDSSLNYSDNDISSDILFNNKVITDKK